MKSYLLASGLAAGVLAMAIGAGCGGEEKPDTTPDTIDLAGTPGNPCFANSTCAIGARCDGGQCTECAIASDSCSCNEAGFCDAGLVCRNGLCEPDLPIDALPGVGCYTPCLQGLVSLDGTERECDTDGLMLGCLSGKTCVDGRCISDTAAQAPTHAQECSLESSCPDFQACVESVCRSTCDSDTQCDPKLRCFRHVCRVECSTIDAPCPAGMYCDTPDGNLGHCMPMPPAQGAPTRKIEGDFAVSQSLIEFNSSTRTAELRVTNNSDKTRTFTVRKLWHLEYRDGASLRVSENPLHWVSLVAPSAAPSFAQEITISIPGRDAGASGGSNQAGFIIADVENPTLARWQGLLEITSVELGSRQISLRYTGSASGRWQGQMVFLANFPANNMDAFLRVRNDPMVTADALRQARANVANALFQKWQLMRAPSGIDGMKELSAVLMATRTESWKSSAMRQKCGATRACYPYDVDFGFRTYSDDIVARPIPTGVSEMPFTMNLKESVSDGALLEGRIESSATLQYPGNPAVTLRFANAPTQCTTSWRNCLVDVAEFRADIDAGGRFQPSEGAVGCGEGVLQDDSNPFVLSQVPWLVPGFLRGTTVQDGCRYRYECRDQLRPFGDTDATHAVNATYSATNPIPDGRTRRRVLSLVDGAMIDQTTLFILFEESFEDFLGNAQDSSFASYGYLLLTREPIDQQPGSTEDPYAGTTPIPPSAPQSNLLGVHCSDRVVTDIFGATTTFADAVADPVKLEALATALVTGDKPNAAPLPLLAEYGNPAGMSVHYLCTETGLFDRGPRPASDPVACPESSEVIYFALPNVTAESIASDSCNHYPVDTGLVVLTRKGGCAARLAGWQKDPTKGVRVDLVRRCTDRSKAYCDSDRTDLLADADFYLMPTDSVRIYNSIRTDIAQAFRYRIRFQNRTGQGLGFAPSICSPGIDSEPYCYDPTTIEGIEERVNCALELFVDHHKSLSVDARTLLETYLLGNFACDQKDGSRCTRYGFEHLNAELLVMLGDEAFTSAFASRFDLAATRQAFFEGDLFEPSGLRIAGIAGQEVQSLYLAAQYYEQALDRFYSVGPKLWATLKTPEPDLPPLAKLDTATTYFARLIRA